MKKNVIAVSINHDFGKIRSDSYNSLLIENIWNFHVIILIKSAVNKNTK